MGTDSYGNSDDGRDEANRSSGAGENVVSSFFGALFGSSRSSESSSKSLEERHVEALEEIARQGKGK